MAMFDIYQELGSAPKIVTFICLDQSYWHILQNPTIRLCVTTVFETAPAPDLGPKKEMIFLSFKKKIYIFLSS